MITTAIIVVLFILVFFNDRIIKFIKTQKIFRKTYMTKHDTESIESSKRSLKTIQFDLCYNKLFRQHPFGAVMIEEIIFIIDQCVKELEKFEKSNSKSLLSSTFNVLLIIENLKYFNNKIKHIHHYVDYDINDSINNDKNQIWVCNAFIDFMEELSNKELTKIIMDTHYSIFYFHHLVNSCKRFVKDMEDYQKETT